MFSMSKVDINFNFSTFSYLLFVVRSTYLLLTYFWIYYAVMSILISAFICK